MGFEDLGEEEEEEEEKEVEGLRKEVKSGKYFTFDEVFNKKIRGKTNLYRIRLGKYRILYEVNEVERRVVILKIDERGKVYK